MAEQTLIDDVRSAKEWADAQARDFDEVRKRLSAIEQAYSQRRGEYANVPTKRPAQVSKVIDEAAEEPGRALLTEARSGRPT